MNGYLIPANTKKGTLIFNIFRPFDLILFLVGVGISISILMFVPTANIVMVVIGCLPGCICGLLVVPIPYYHNVLCAIQSMLNFYTSNRKYRWRGWCFYERFVKEESKNSK